MKKTIKILLLAVLAVCTVCALTVMAGATETVTDVDSGYVMMYQSDKTTAIEDADRTETELQWKVQDITDGETAERVLTITGSDTTLTFNSSAAWNNMGAATIPWWSYIGSITKVVIEAPITKITQACAFNKLAKVHTFVLPDTKITIASGLSMPFAGMSVLTCFGPEGTPENTIDLRNFTHTGSQAFENTCSGKTITVLMPYVDAAPLGTAKLFSKTTVATFKVLENSPSEKFVTTTYPAATENIYIPAENMSLEYYTGLVITGQESDANGRNFKWTLDVDSGALAIEKHEEPTADWAQIDFQDANWTAFASGWKNYVKDATVVYFGKISFGNSGTQCFLAGSTSLETVRFASGQRLQNGRASGGYGWFNGCTALKSVTFGTGEFVAGVADLSGANITAGQDTETTWLANMFTNCDDIEKIILPTKAAVTTLHASTISGCTSLKEIVIGSNITTIEEGTFDAWTSSTEGYSALTLTFTEENSALGSSIANAGLLTVVVPVAATSGDVSGDATDDNDLAWAFDVATGKLTISGTSTEIVWAGGGNAGWNGTTSDYSMVPWYANYASLIKTVEITAPVTAIPQYMFSTTTKVETVILPDTCVALGDCAFNACKKLTSVQVAGKDTPAGVIDLRCITGTSGIQIFENAFEGEVTVWLPQTAENLNLNDKFGVAATKAHFVVYPGSAGETTVYEMINNTAASVYGEITYSYYTAAEDADLAAAWNALTSGVATVKVDYGVANWTIDVETGIVTVTTTKSAGGSTTDCTVDWNETAWVTFVNTFKYAIKVIKFNTGAKLNASNTLSNLPELTTVLFNGTRMQGSTKFNNNPKLTTVGTSSNYVNGVVNLSTWQDINNSHNHSTLLANTFEGCTSITKVILPTVGTKYAVISLAANAFKGCTSLETIVIPEGCALLSTQTVCNEGTSGHVASAVTGTIDSTAFADLTTPVMIINEAADTTIADALLAILPTDSYIYEEAASSAEGLTGGVVFDGWKVRVAGYNGLRGIFYYDEAATADNDDNGWTLVEYGALLSTAKNKAVTGAVVYYDSAKGVTADATTKLYPIMRNNGTTLEQVGKVLSNTDDVENADNVYFAVSVVKYSKNYTTDLYMAGYEVYTNAAGDVVIMYTPYGNEDFVETSIYDVSLSMFKAGALTGLDNENIVWNSLTAGGGLVLEEGTHYTLDDEKIDGTPTSMVTGEAFGSTFNAWDVPVVNTVVDTTITFTKTNLTYSLLADPDAEGKYILVYRGSGKLPGANPYGGTKKFFPQLRTDWYTGATVATSISNVMPNPRLTTNIWGTALSTIILDSGVTSMEGACIIGSGASTLIYSDTLTTIPSTSFQNSSITTAYLAGSDYVEGVVEISGVKTVSTNYLFDGCKAVKAVHLPANVIINQEIFKSCSALERVWIGDNEMPEVGVVDFSNLTESTTSIKAHCFYNATSITTLIIPETVTSIDEKAFENVKTLTIQQPASVEAISSYVNTVNATEGYSYTYYVPESLAGWSGIIVK